MTHWSLTVINLNKLFLIPEVQLCGQWLHRTALFVIAQLIFKWKKKLVSFTVSQDKLSFAMGTSFPVLGELQDASRKFTTVENEESLN